METSGVAYRHILKEQILDFPGKINGCPFSSVKRVAHAGSMGARPTDAAAGMTAKPRGWLYGMGHTVFPRDPEAGGISLRYLSRSCCC